MKKKYILPIILGLLLAPAFMYANHTRDHRDDDGRTFGSNVVDFLVGSPCLVPVYHTNFIFPPEGGVVIRDGDQLYFVPDYLDECEDFADLGEVVRDSDDRSDGTRTRRTGGGAAVINFFVGDNCLVPVYHTNFLFPREGGVIIEIGDQLYFVPDYLDECEDVADQGDIVRDSTDAPSEVTSTRRSGGGAVLNFFLGDPCLVPVYHSNFIFPPEGGEIVEIDNQLYFAKTYLDGCENAGN